MSDFRVPMPEINGHPGNERINWQLRLPPYVDQSQLTVDLGAIGSVADSGDIANVYVLPSDGLRLRALADGGFDSGIPAVTGEEIAELAIRADGKWYFPISSETDEETGRSLTHVGLRVPVRAILDELREVSAEANSPLWVKYLNRELGASLGYAAFGNRLPMPRSLLAPGRLAVSTVSMLHTQAKNAKVIHYVAPPLAAADE